MIDLINIDCLEYMRGLPDQAFDLAITDPMYKMDEKNLIPGAEFAKNGVRRQHRQLAKDLAKLPITGIEYYNELCRVSKHQIIWGINYYEFAGLVPGRLVWDKKNDSSSFSNAELASCSLIQGVRMFRYMWNGMLQENMKNKERRIHPFQKPVPLYKWCLSKFAQPGFKILDTHCGSGSLALACHDMGFDFTGLEINPEIYASALKRYEQHAAQVTMF